MTESDGVGGVPSSQLLLVDHRSLENPVHVSALLTPAAEIKTSVAILEIKVRCIWYVTVFLFIILSLHYKYAKNLLASSHKITIK
jgi:hypothetical protein